MSTADDEQHKAPEEGLNGSNVPGLAPRSIPSSRRASGNEDASKDEQVKTATDESLADLTTAFDQINVANEADKSTEVKSTSVEPATPSPSSGVSLGSGVAAIAAANSTTGQQSVLQRAITRANLEAQQNNASLGPNSASSGNAAESGMTPVFNERFLFDDDDLEADDSAFVKKYNLKEDDNSFPVLIHRDSHPGMVSTTILHLLKWTLLILI